MFIRFVSIANQLQTADFLFLVAPLAEIQLLSINNGQFNKVVPQGA